MLYRYKIIPMSPLITPLMSDTLFGHLCWALRYDRGEDFLLDFLDSYGDGKSAPVLFSSAFIAGRLPRPVLPPLDRARAKRFAEEILVHDNVKLFKNMTDKQKLFTGINLIKAWNKLDYLTVDQWENLKDNYSELRLMQIFFEELVRGGRSVDLIPFETEVCASNAISRITGTVSAETGGLFQREKTWYHEGTTLDLYVEINSEEMAPIVSNFLTDYLPATGFGADKTVGMGELAISMDNGFEVDRMHSRTPNAQLCLSLTAFFGIERYKAYYRLKTKFGRLGGDFAVSSPTGGNPKPFKRPVLMYEPGAVFLCREGFNDKPLLKNVHSDHRIRHCGIPVTLPFKISEDMSYENIAA